MRAFIFTAAIIGFSSACYAQKKEAQKVKFTPPVIVKDATVKSKPHAAATFTPPVAARNKKAKSRKAKENQHVKFTPPVIVKDSDKKE